MIYIGFVGNALAGAEPENLARLKGALHAVDLDGERNVQLLLGLLVGLPHLLAESAASAVDDILGLEPMEMGGGLLAYADCHYLLAIGLAAFADIAVADGDEGQADLFEISAAEIGDVPAEAVLTDFIALMSLFGPVFRSPVRSFRKVEAELIEHGLCVFDDLVNF